MDHRSLTLQINLISDTDTRHFYSCNHQKWIPYQIIGGKTVMNVQIDTQTTEIWSIKKWVLE